MWADFLSHFSEIGMVEGAQNYEVIKQRPADGDSSSISTAKSTQNQEEEKKGDE